MRGSEKCLCIDADHPYLSIAHQCRLLSVSRSRLYYRRAEETDLNLEIMNRIDEIHTAHPFYGWRRITAVLNRGGYEINPKRVRRLMSALGLHAIVPYPTTSKSDPKQQKFPYLLRGLAVVRPLQVVSSDITYIRLQSGFVYLVAVIDWFSRMILAWRLSNSLEGAFCIEAFEESLEWGTPEIFNTDQGVQFASNGFVDAVLSRGVRLSMDGKGRALDNIFVERFWRSLKYEEVYLRDYETVLEAREQIAKYCCFYNTERPHQSLDYHTPLEIHQHPEMLLGVRAS